MGTTMTIAQLYAGFGDLSDPQPEWFAIKTVAHALSDKTRFCGQAKVKGYTVAQHCVLVSRLFTDRHLALFGLLHELDEVVLPDMPSSLKAAPSFAFYRELCELHMKAGCAHFCLEYPWPTEVKAAIKAADTILLATEARDVMGGQTFDWELGHEPLAERIDVWPAHRAEQRFLERFAELTGPIPTLATAKAVAREALSGDRDLREAHEAILLLLEGAGQ